MGQVLHRSATTTEAIRRARQRYGLHSKAGAPADAQEDFSRRKTQRRELKPKKVAIMFASIHR